MLKRQHTNASGSRKQNNRVETDDHPPEDDVLCWPTTAGGYQPQQQSSRNISSSSNGGGANNNNRRSIQKCYSVDDNFYSFGYSSGNPRHATKKNRRIIRPLSSSTSSSAGNKQVAPSREDVIFKRFLKGVFSTGGGNNNNSAEATGTGGGVSGGVSAAKEWLTVSASNVMEFAPKILSRKFCGKKNSSGNDNELYPSNSFRFQRYDKNYDADDNLSIGAKSTISRQISLCDDYSLPVDFINKRPLSLDSGTFWDTSNPNSEQLDVLNLYCDPNNSKETRSEGTGSIPDDLNFYNNPTREYSDPYTDSTENDPEDEEFLRDSNCDLFSTTTTTQQSTTTSRGGGEQQQQQQQQQQFLKPSTSNKNFVDVRNSPYYYGDLLKKRQEQQTTSSQDHHQHHNNRHHHHHHHHHHHRCSKSGFYRKCSSLDAPANSSSAVKHLPPQRAHSNASVVREDAKCCNKENSGFDIREEDEYLEEQEKAEGEEEEEEEQEQEEKFRAEESAIATAMAAGNNNNNNNNNSRQRRQMYETAFDSKVIVGRSTEMLALDVDAVANHVMDRCSPQTPHNFCTPCILQKNNRKIAINRSISSSLNNNNNNNKYDSPVEILAQNLTDLDLSSDHQPLLTQYSSASSSTIARPNTLSSTLNESIDSSFSESSAKANDKQPPPPIVIPNISSSSQAGVHVAGAKRQSRAKLPSCCRRYGLKKSPCDIRPKSCHLPPSEKILQIKNRPPPALPPRGGKVAAAVGVHEKFSSTESMTNSSSGGSLESIRSSTSEGNRSTSSTDSHLSSSLSSHSSESSSLTNNGGFHCGVGVGISHGNGGSRYFNHPKMHILSPISDKSFQEFANETTSELQKTNNNPPKDGCFTSVLTDSSNKNNIGDDEDNKAGLSDTHQTVATGGAIANADSASSAAAAFKLNKRRLPPPPPNKNLLNLSSSACDTETHHGSDSGISMIESSRCDGAAVGVGIQSGGQSNEFQDLPFDMPKLRRKRLQQMQSSTTQDTSSSATSVDLKDLPFDMPKLRRRLRNSLNSQGSADDTSGIAVNGCCEATVENEDLEDNSVRLQPSSKTEEQAKNRKSLGLSLNLNELNTGNNSVNFIDVTVPLDRQGWYHGAITRMEAENELRQHNEGSYLVRNSESAKHDFSLSLKSAKGFMHMRIQKCTDSNGFILGQFSSPFETIPHMIKFYSSNQLPIRGAEHMCLVQPVIAQLL